MEYSVFDIFVFLIAIGIALFFVLVFAIKFFLTEYLPFAEERDYIGAKIQTKTGEERVFWQSELQNLYIGLIPFLGEYIVRKRRKRKRK